MMTDEITDELVDAIWREAWAKTYPGDHLMGLKHYPTAAKAIRLALSGWRPTDPDLILARESVALELEKRELHVLAASAREGGDDGALSVQSALRAIKAVRAQMEGGQ